MACVKLGAWCVVQQATWGIAYQTSTFSRRPWLCAGRRYCPGWHQLGAAHRAGFRQPRTACCRPARSPSTPCTAVYYDFSRAPSDSTRQQWPPPRPWSDHPRWPSSRLRWPWRRRRRRHPGHRQTPALTQSPPAEVAVFQVTRCLTAVIGIGRICRRRH